jgi:hypothetical protein
MQAVRYINTIVVSIDRPIIKNIPNYSYTPIYEFRIEHFPSGLAMNLQKCAYQIRHVFLSVLT